MTLTLEPAASGLIGQQMTVEEFARLPDTGGLELDNGTVVGMNMGAESSWIAGEIHGQLRDFLKQSRLGWAFPEGTAYECFPPTPSRVRKPDVSFVQSGRLPGGRPPEGNITVVPDLAVEVVSPNDTSAEVERKVRQFRAAGVRLIWVVFPETRDARVFRPGGSVSDVEPDGFLDGEDVLPGFRLRLSDLFPGEGARPEQRQS